MAQLKQKSTKVVGVKNFNNQNNVMSNTTQIIANHKKNRKKEEGERTEVENQNG